MGIWLPFHRLYSFKQARVSPVEHPSGQRSFWDSFIFCWTYGTWMFTDGIGTPDPNPINLVNWRFYFSTSQSSICLNRFSGALVGVRGSDFIGRRSSRRPCSTGPASAAPRSSATGAQSYISKGIWRQRMGSSVRKSFASTLWPVVVCAYLCTSEVLPHALRIRRCRRRRGRVQGRHLRKQITITKTYE